MTEKKKRNINGLHSFQRHMTQLRAYERRKM